MGQGTTRRILVSLAFALIAGTSALAQGTLSDSAARQAAREACRILGSPSEFGPKSVVEREGAPGSRQTPIVRVSDGELMVTLDQAGNFLGFNDLSAAVLQPPDGPPRYPNVMEAWAALNTALRKLKVPEEQRKKTAVAGKKPPMLKLRMQPEPYGYPAFGGNLVDAKLHAVTGKFVSLLVGRGWTYEPPNIRVKSKAAIATTIATLGGLQDEWEATLSYRTASASDAPEAIQKLNLQRTMRLCYDVSSTWGNVIVDSVTGEVVHHERARGMDGKVLIPVPPTGPRGGPPSEIFTVRNITLGSALAVLTTALVLLLRHRR